MGAGSPSKDEKKDTLEISSLRIPVSHAWTGWTEEKTYCISINGLAWFTLVLNMVLDSAIIILPVPQLLKLHLSFSKKIRSWQCFAWDFS
jgi:hypothetical protein